MQFYYYMEIVLQWIYRLPISCIISHQQQLGQSAGSNNLRIKSDTNKQLKQPYNQSQSQKTSVMKTQQQYEYEQAIRSLDMQFQIFENPKSNSKLTENRLNDLQGMVKNCKNLFDKVEERMKANMRNRSYNEDDIKYKLKNYGDSLNKIKDRFKKLSDKIVAVQMQDLTQNRSINPTETDALKLLNANAARVDNINKQAEQTLGIYNEVINEADRQNKLMDDMNEDADEIEHELGMSDQLMRVISNRELLTKLILVVLAGFLGFADILILFVKMF